ncbi:Bet_v_1 domain-containing protein [Caenorhabditis elegans]|uniref:Bet_v_1 domain-containing protein n=1 Tax=Caenorhabditis elegans TaxID=6239 RepID=A0A8D6XJG8_CAEEL|nr:Bet_v_1 domain-containing protein [Caenorhabditis elegans]CAB63386.2 Bet_v_1 domain-containing protein [Caenorhabditis elegans]
MEILLHAIRDRYKRFAMMWHPEVGNDEYMTVQMLSQDEQKLSARVTMKLEMGINTTAKVWEWNFKITANLNSDKKWYITYFEFMCNPFIKYMDESLISIRDVATEKFLSTMRDQQPPVSWWSTVEFVKQFQKDEKMEAQICAVDYTDIPLPATESTYFKIKTIAKGYSPAYRFVHNWEFHIKWDKMDQFYYIHKIDISCGKQVSDWAGERYVFISKEVWKRDMGLG